MKDTAIARSTLILYGLLFCSFVLHALTLVAVLQARALAKDQLTLLTNNLVGIETQTITTTIRVKQDVPITAAIPINKSIVIPINTIVNIDQVIAVPITAPSTRRHTANDQRFIDGIPPDNGATPLAGADE